MKQSVANDLSPRQIRRAKYEGDPLVPYSRESFNAAFAESRFASKRGGKASFAEALRQYTGRNTVKRQAVEGWLRGPAKGKCRLSMRTAWAVLLDVPDPFLAGESVTVPFSASLRLGLPINGLPVLSGPAAQMSQRVQLAKIRLVDKCVNACRDDCKLLVYPASESENGKRIEVAALMFAASAVLDLASSRRWRSALLQSKVTEVSMSEAERDALLSEAGFPPCVSVLTDEEERSDLANVHMLLRVLAPWLVGKECLNYGGLRRIFVGLSPIADMPTSLCAQPTAVRRGDGSIVHVADRFTPLALFGWSDLGQGGPMVGESERCSLADRPSRAKAL